MDVWKEILVNLGTNAAMLVVLGFLARSLLNTWLTKDVKRFEADLKASADSELEHLKYELKSKADASIAQLKSHLQQTATEHHVRFSKLHEKRAEVIGEVYARLVDAQREGRRFVATDAYLTDHQQQKEAVKKAAERMQDVSCSFKNIGFIYRSTSASCSKKSLTRCHGTLRLLASTLLSPPKHRK